MLRYTTGGCSGGIDHVDQRATDEHVVITLWDRRQVSGDCEDWGAEARDEVQLDAPLLGRTLLDGYCTDPRPGSAVELCPDGEVPTQRTVTGA